MDVPQPSPTTELLKRGSKKIRVVGEPGMVAHPSAHSAYWPRLGTAVRTSRERRGCFQSGDTC